MFVPPAFEFLPMIDLAFFPLSWICITSALGSVRWWYRGYGLSRPLRMTLSRPYSLLSFIRSCKCTPTQRLPKDPAYVYNGLRDWILDWNYGRLRLFSFIFHCSFTCILHFAFYMHFLHLTFLLSQHFEFTYSPHFANSCNCILLQLNCITHFGYEEWIKMLFYLQTNF